MKIVRFRPLILVSTLAAGLLAAGSAFADLDPVLLNADFEDPVEAPNSITEISQTGIPGWTGNYIGGSTHEYIINGNVQNSSGDLYGTTPYGQQYLGLNGVYRRSFHSIESQTVANFVEGETYEFGVYFSNIGGATGPGLSIAVTDGADGTGTEIASQIFQAQTAGPYGDGPIGFTLATLDFTAISTGSVSFSLGNQSLGTIALDNASLRVLAVPEPSTWTLLVLGGGLALAGLRVRFLRSRPA